MNAWNKIMFKNFIQLQRGFDLPKGNFKEGKFPVVGSTSILGYHNEFKIKGPGVITGRSGSLGIIQYLENEYWPHNTSLWVKDFKGNYPKFVYFFLKTLDFENFNSGGAVPTLNRNHLDNIRINIPKKNIQQKIASILSAYDDLIENNNRRIALLEKMAENLYKEWFVRMRFPGYENTKYIDSLPDGWRLKPVNDCFETLGGGTPSKDNESYWKNGKINWYTPSDITSGHSFIFKESKLKTTVLGLKESSAKPFPPFSVMMTSRATIGEVGLNITEACTNQGFITCIPNSMVPYSYILFWIKENKTRFELLASGATFKEISRGVFRKIDFLLPSESVLSQFHAIIKPIIELIYNLLNDNELLKQSRNRLLPKLISGKLSIEHLVELEGKDNIQLGMVAEPNKDYLKSN